jgi:outer membrane protein
MRKHLVITLLAGAFAGFGTSAYSADLMQVYTLALANDPVYTSARYAADAGQTKSTQGLSVLLPSIGVSGSYTRSGDGLNDTNNTYSLALKQPLLRLDSWEVYRQGNLAVAASEIQFAIAKQDLMLRVSQAYFDVLSAQDTLGFLRAQKKSIAEQLASAKRNFEVGTATITDTNEAQARYDLAIAQEFAAENTLSVAENTLTQIIGAPSGPLSNLRKDVQLTPPEPNQMATWTESAQQQNFGVLAQTVALDVAKSQTRQNRAGHAPTVDLQVARTFIDKKSQSNPFESGRGFSNSVGVQWTIPLFSGFAVSSKVSESLALADKARSDLENARRSAIVSAQQAYLGVNSGLSQVKAYEAAEISSVSSVQSNLLGYQVGVRINIDVLNAEQQLFSTRKDLAKARYDTLMNGLKLKAAAGILQESDLEALNRLLTAPQPIAQ